MVLKLFSKRFGGTTFYSYVASPIAFKKLEREQFSILQHNIFPMFFQMQAISPVILGLTAPIALTTGAIASLVTASVSGALNYLVLLPVTRGIKEERKKIANELSGEELELKDAPLRKSFGQSHGLSLLLNMTNVLGTLAYGIYLSKGVFKYIPK